MYSQINPSLYSKKDESKIDKILTVLIFIVAAIIILEIAFTVTYSGIYVVEHSMTPTLIGADSEDEAGGDYVYVNKFAKPGYGNIVVVYKDDGTKLIKRAIAFGGDRVKLVEGRLYIKYAGTDKFEEIDQSYIDADLNDPTMGKNNYPGGYNSVEEEGHLVADGCMFLLGDNRNGSNDSRAMGDFSLDSLFGVVTEWSIKHKAFFTSVHTFFVFDTPAFFVRIFGING